MMFLVALTAVTRRIVVMDTGKMDAVLMFGIGFLVIALAVGYYLIRKKRPESAD